jgi:hypothetical protein
MLTVTLQRGETDEDLIPFACRSEGGATHGGRPCVWPKIGVLGNTGDSTGLALVCGNAVQAALVGKLRVHNHGRHSHGRCGGKESSCVKTAKGEVEITDNNKRIRRDTRLL